MIEHGAWGMEHGEIQPFDKLRTGWQQAGGSGQLWSEIGGKTKESVVRCQCSVVLET